jgi:mRNA interferase HigB
LRIIKPSRIREYGRQYPDADAPLRIWLNATKGNAWHNIGEVRKTYRSADAVRVASERTVTVFNIGGNKYRLVVAIHYNVGAVFILRFLTHAEYDKNAWKG